MRCGALFPDGVVYSTENGWARCFNMAAEGVAPGDPQFTTKSVTFGVQTVIVTDPQVDIQVDVVLYADSDGGAPPGPGSAGPADPTITELAREIIFVTPADVGTFITVPIVGVLELGAGDLIVEIEQTTDGTEDPLHSFRIVSNDGGECGASYLRAAPCGIPGWIPLGAIGFPDNQYVICVEGELGPPPCPATSCSNICDCSVTQSNNTEEIETMVACASALGTTDQGWARCYDFAGEDLPTNPLGYTIQSVTFGVLQASVDGIEVDVAVYDVSGIGGCRVDFSAPGDPGVIEIARESILVNNADIGTFIKVDLSDKPKVSQDAQLVVEIEQLVNGSVDEPDNFQFRPSGNTNGECQISYIRAALCGIPFWLGNDFINFDFIHTTMIVAIESNKKEAFVDIKPGSCPNPLNRDSNGVLPVALSFGDGKSAEDVDLSTLQIHRADGVGGFVDAFSGRPGPKRNLEDVMTPFGGEACDCHSATGDGTLDVQMKFDVAELRSALELGALPKRTILELCITGRNNDGTPFIGCDCVRIQGRGASR